MDRTVTLLEKRVTPNLLVAVTTTLYVPGFT